MLKYFTSLFFFLSIPTAFSQEKTMEIKDSVVYKTNYGLRVGVDISKPIRGAIQNFYNGFEFVADYRISKNLYIATEFGFEEQISREDFMNVTDSGNYIRLGVNLNTYKNWLDMNNEIYVGGRLGFSFFEQTLNEYTLNPGNGGYYGETITTPSTEDGLNAEWLEFVVGIKAEVYRNLFLSFSGSFKAMLQVKDPTNYKSLFAPGFNRIYVNNVGFGFNYTISYLIPFENK